MPANLQTSEITDILICIHYAYTSNAHGRPHSLSAVFVLSLSLPAGSCHPAGSVQYAVQPPVVSSPVFIYETAHVMF